MKRIVSGIIAGVLMICFVSCAHGERGKEQTAQSSTFVFSEINSEFTTKETAAYEESVYKIEFEFRLISNDSVGNEWEKCVYLNGKKIDSGEIINAKIEEFIVIKVEITENDKIPDSGSGSVQLSVKDGQSGSMKITVCENRGQYLGNAALWEFRYSIYTVNT